MNFPHAPQNEAAMTETQRDALRREDHTLIGQLMGMVRQIMAAQTTYQDGTARRISALEQRVEGERLRGEMRDRELRAVAQDVAEVREATGRIETNTSVIVAQLKAADTAQGKQIEEVSRRPRSLLAVTLDAPAMRIIASMIGGALMGAVALYSALYGTPAWLAPLRTLFP